MGVTIYANGVSRSFDCGYIGFAHLRQNIARVFDSEFGEAYSDVLKCFRDPDGYDYAINKILLDKRFTESDDDILDFMFASDCGGKVHYKTCKKIYNLIKDIDFCGKVFVYGAYSDGKDYEHFKEFLKECYAKRAYMRWS